MLTVVNATLNVRGGPGTNFPVIGQVRQGQQFEITGKNPAGDWWQINYEGQAGWVLGTMVSANEAATSVQVAANIPAAPTARPQPTAGPRPPAQPTTAAAPPPPAASSYPFVAAGSEWRPNTNDRVTVRCRVNINSKTMRGSSGILQVRGPVSSAPQAFSEIIDVANTGMDKTMQYMYNSGCKIELAPFVAGTYTAVLVDGGGNQIADPINFTADGDMREFIVTWKAR